MVSSLLLDAAEHGSARSGKLTGYPGDVHCLFLSRKTKGEILFLNLNIYLLFLNAKLNLLDIEGEGVAGVLAPVVGHGCIDVVFP